MLLALLLACDSTHGGPATSPSPGQMDTAEPEWDPRYNAFDAALREDMAAYGAPSISAAIMEGGEMVFAVAYGEADPSTGRAATTETLYQIGSTTKMMTATSVLQAVQRGELDVDMTLSQALPGFEFALDESWDDQVRVHHLLTHQGGFFDWLDWEQRSSDELLHSYTYGTYADNLWLMNPPGLFHNYSNPNFVLAGLAAELADGERYWPDIVEQDVLSPLGMDRSYARKSSVEADGDWALGYGVDAATGRVDVIAFDEVPDPGWARPAGLVWSTPSQVVRFGNFLLHGDSDVLDDDLRRELVAEQVNTAYFGDKLYYGYGVFLNRGFQLGDDWYDTPLWHHGGNTLSYTSALYMLPESDLVVSILIGAYGAPLAASTEQALLLGDLPVPTDVPQLLLDTEGLAAHVGTYVDQYNVGDIVITLEGDQLYVEMPLLEDLGYSVEPALYSVGTDLHYVSIDGSYYDLTFFEGDRAGQSQYVRNRSFVGTRDESVSMAPTPRPATREQIDELLRRARLPAF